MRRGDAKCGLKLNIQKTIHKIILNIHGIQSHNSWHIDEGKVETVTDFLFLGSKITMDLYCSHKIKRHLLLEGSTAMKNLNSVIKPEAHFATEVCSVKDMIFFPVIMYRCTIWTKRG